MTREEVIGDLKRCIAHLNPTLKWSDIKFQVSSRHLLNVVVSTVSCGKFPRNDIVLDRLIRQSRNTEDFIRGLQTVAFEVPTGDELLKALEEIKDPTEHIVAETMTND